MSTSTPSPLLPALARLLARAAAREWLSEREALTVESSSASLDLEYRLNPKSGEPADERKTASHD